MKRLLFDNALAFARVEIKHSWSKWNQPVDYKEWGMPAHMVNAYYNPRRTWLSFQRLFYSTFLWLASVIFCQLRWYQAVIAHEISHAFDTNGASFDENGSLKIGGRERLCRLQEKTQKSLTSLMDRILMEQPSTVNDCIRKRLTWEESAAALKQLNETRLLSRRILLQLRSHLAYERSSEFETLG